MDQVRVKELMLVAVASSLLAFEVIGLRGALPGAMRSLASEGVVDAIKSASRGAAVATASLLDGAGASAAQAAVGAAKGAARMFGTVAEPVNEDPGPFEHASSEDRAREVPRLVVVTVKDARYTEHVACRSVRRTHAAPRAAASAKPSTL